MIKHAMCGTRFYKILEGMKSRCLNKNNPRYKDYGGRGITVCENWKNFINFKNDMYESYLNHVEIFGEKNTTIDRINNNGNYELTNCRWFTCKEQSNNRRDKITQKQFKAISPNGEIFYSNNKTKFAKEHNLYRRIILNCLKKISNSHKGWKFENV